MGRRKLTDLQRKQRYIERVSNYSPRALKGQQTRLKNLLNKAISQKTSTEEALRSSTNRTDRIRLKYKIFEDQSQINEVKNKYYAYEDAKVIKALGVSLPDSISDEEQAILDEIEYKLDEYSKGDQTMDQFYNVYGFNRVTRENVYAYAKLENLL